MSSNCQICKSFRLAFVCTLSGGLAGFLANYYDLGSTLEMSATFSGAMFPLLWNKKHQSHS